MVVVEVIMVVVVGGGGFNCKFEYVFQNVLPCLGPEILALEQSSFTWRDGGWRIKWVITC